MKRNTFAFGSAALIAFLICRTLSAETTDWPTHLGDNARRGIARAEVSFPLREQWRFKSALEPQPAWPPPALQDYWHYIKDLRPVMTFDRSFQPVAAKGIVCFGSSADDCVYALKASTGEILWSFFAEGPIRLAPTIHRDRVLFGSEDGFVYCLSAADGALAWKHRIGPTDRRLPGNGRMMSLWPVRTGVLVIDDVAYCCGGIFPIQGVYLAALRVSDGKLLWKKQLESVSPQGHIVAAGDKLFIPTGRTTPVVVERESGKVIGGFEGQGGAWTVVTDDYVLNGPGRRSGGVDLSDTATREHIATFDGLHVIVDGGTAYLHSKNRVAAFDRVKYVELVKQRNILEAQSSKIEDKIEEHKNRLELGPMSQAMKENNKLKKSISDLSGQMQKCFAWGTECNHQHSFIMVGKYLVTGGDGEIAAFSVTDGKRVWTAPVSGKAYSLAFAEGQLIVSTDEGTVHCFGSSESSDAKEVVQQTKDKAFPEDKLTPLYEAAAAEIVKLSGADQGYCLVLECKTGRLAAEIAARTRLKVIGVESNPENVAKARKALAEAGLYGSRISIHQGTLDSIRYPTGFANLICSEDILLSGKMPAPAAEIDRLARPLGGFVCLGMPQGGAGVSNSLSVSVIDAWLKKNRLAGWRNETGNGTWAVLRRGDVPGAGEWTHFLADPGNTACSKDALRNPTDIQWFGLPGPRNIINRHSRPMSPLYKDGRVYVPADNLVVALDAYNGTILWQTPVPDSRRLAAFKDSGQMVVTGDALYIATADECRMLNCVNGEVKSVLKAPQVMKDRTDHWGYLAVVGDLVFGSGKIPNSSFYQISRANCAEFEGDFLDVIVSDYLFCVDRRTGRPAWTWRDGVVMNSAIAVGEGKVFCLRSLNPRVVDDPNGRIRIDYFCAEGAALVALDAASGKELWKREVKLPFQHILYLSYSDGTIVLTGTFNKDNKAHYGIETYTASNGEPMWQTSYNSGRDINGSHGEQWQHPVIMNGKVYSVPYDFDLKTGAKGNFEFQRGGGGCGTISASEFYFFARAGNPRMYDISSGGKTSAPLSLVNRPGCFINIVPAGGLVLIPESSSGCTCAYPMQLSIAFAPALSR
ncbi:MAG TPA: PQQ-binding-like beta-propeller repeat protein [Candidatus Brocadiia bacterium]|nr:PQQ-binding-like beta-propeller repeat protein [Candidatus Brocadiia bacterium]